MLEHCTTTEAWKGDYQVAGTQGEMKYFDIFCSPILEFEGGIGTNHMQLLQALWRFTCLQGNTALFYIAHEEFEFQP